MIDQQTLKRIRDMASSAALPALSDRIKVTRDGEPVYEGVARFTATGAKDLSLSASMVLQQQTYAQVEIPNGSAALLNGDFVEVLASIEPALVGRSVYVRHSAPVTSWAPTIKFNVLLT